MRLVLEIPHPKYKIQWFLYNAKYILKVELGAFEQVYKIDELEITNIDELENIVNSKILNNCLDRFIEMRNDWIQSINNK